MSGAAGTLYLVGTPIGNLEDITLRAIRVLKEADLIAAEDTRRAQILLRRHGIKKPLLSYYDPAEAGKSQGIVEKLKQGEKVALISESGMPGISDPGYRLVRGAVDAGIRVVPVPGPSAILAALVVSGLAADRFAFEGFLPSRPIALRKKLCSLRDEERTMVFFESPRRLVSALSEMLKIFGERRIAVARELTKRFEEVVRGTIGDTINELKGRVVKGEVVIVLEGRKGHPQLDRGPAGEQIARLQKELGISRMEAIKLTAKLRGVAKSEVYREVHREKSR